MSTTVATTAKADSKPLFNLPNQLTTIRLVLSLILFGLIDFGWHLTSAILFVIAASTDWLDGYYARKYGMVTTLGRILDPFVDKVIICGTFIFLMPIATSGVTAWMVVVIVGRELLVTALRSFLEKEGADFSASLSGKLKMVLQCGAAGFSLFFISYATPSTPVWLLWTRDLLLWSAVALTVVSGVIYVRAAIVLLKQQK